MNDKGEEENGEINTINSSCMNTINISGSYSSSPSHASMDIFFFKPMFNSYLGNKTFIISIYTELSYFFIVTLCRVHVSAST